MALRVSTPVSCHTIQSAASISRSARAYTSGSSWRICSAFAKNHSDEILPPYRASHGSPRLRATALTSVRLRLRGVVLPELHPRVRVAAEIGQPAQRRPVRRRREHRARGEVDADPDDLGRADTAAASSVGHRVPAAAHVVGGILQRPVRLELDVGVGRSRSSMTPFA